MYCVVQPLILVDLVDEDVIVFQLHQSSQRNQHDTRTTTDFGLPCLVPGLRASEAPRTTAPEIQLLTHPHPAYPTQAPWACKMTSSLAKPGGYFSSTHHKGPAERRLVRKIDFFILTFCCLSSFLNFVRPTLATPGLHA